MKAKKVLNVYGEEVVIDESLQKVYSYDNAKKEIVYNAPIIKDGEVTKFWTDYIADGIVDDIEVRLNTWNNPVKLYYATLVKFDADNQDPDKKTWHEIVAAVKNEPEKYFFKNGNWRKKVEANLKTQSVQIVDAE